jgi:hypothetical protein
MAGTDEGVVTSYEDRPAINVDLICYINLIKLTLIGCLYSLGNLNLSQIQNCVAVNDSGYFNSEVCSQLLENRERLGTRSCYGRVGLPREVFRA